jgi:hypothetical protein
MTYLQAYDFSLAAYEPGYQVNLRFWYNTSYWQTTDICIEYPWPNAEGIYYPPDFTKTAYSWSLIINVIHANVSEKAPLYYLILEGQAKFSDWVLNLQNA